MAAEFAGLTFWEHKHREQAHLRQLSLFLLSSGWLPVLAGGFSAKVILPKEKVRHVIYPV
jgi:hypothetical protein